MILLNVIYFCKMIFIIIICFRIFLLEQTILVFEKSKLRTQKEEKCNFEKENE